MTNYLCRCAFFHSLTFQYHSDGQCGDESLAADAVRPNKKKNKMSEAKVGGVKTSEGREFISINNMTGNDLHTLEELEAKTKGCDK